MDVSDEEDGDGGSDDEEGGGGGGGKRLRNGRLARPSAQAEALRRQLAALVAEPLAPRMSSRWVDWSVGLFSDVRRTVRTWCRCRF